MLSSPISQSRAGRSRDAEQFDFVMQSGPNLHLPLLRERLCNLQRLGYSVPLKMSASYIPTSPRKRKRRPPVSPSSSCEVCRSYYQEETQLDNELLSVLKDFEWQMRVQANDMQSLQHTQQVWDQKPPSGLSPDIQHLHYHRKHEVLGMLHTAYDEHAEKVKRWLEFHKNARQHQGSLATKPVPHGSPRLYMQCNVKRQRKGAKQRSTASDPEHR
eukprot:Sspe_Gene.109079::Locus_88454_Transcript_1_1_Confidence_1.000_Length_786::g.109079::m.109079